LSQERILRWSYLRLDQSAYHGWLSMMTSSEGPPCLVLPRAPPTLNPPLTICLTCRFCFNTSVQILRFGHNTKSASLTGLFVAYVVIYYCTCNL